MAKPRQDDTIGFGIAVAAAASGLAVSAAGWTFGALPFWLALIFAGASVAIGFAVATPWRRDVTELLARARSIGEEDVGPMPAARRTEMGASLPAR